ncbi:MAG: hypothetical protein MUD01_01035 [Chloroflexaceae bacterium]|jgi:hypothetical protein|nr:hypothetical protein [Chloroflexaceae bacterium]
MKTTALKMAFGLMLINSLIAALLFGVVFYMRYLRWLDCFNELGRCANPDGSGNVYTTASLIWAFPFGIFLLMGLVFGVLFWWVSRRT